MTHLNIKATKENFWRWIVFSFKAYIIAVPAALLICDIAGRPVPANTPDTYYRFLEDGYGACLAVLALETACAKDKKRIRIALIFMVLTVISMIVFYPDTLVVPR